MLRTAYQIAALTVAGMGWHGAVCAQSPASLENNFLQLVCGNGAELAISCDSPVFAGAAEAGLELSANTPYWFNICNTEEGTPPIPWVINWRSECVATYPRGSITQEIRVGHPVSNSRDRIDNSVIGVLNLDAPTSINWSYGRHGVVADMANLRSQNAMLGNYSRGFYLLFEGRSLTYVVLPLLLMVLPMLLFLRDVGAGVERGRSIGIVRLFRHVLVIGLVSIIPLMILSARGSGIPEEEAGFVASLADVNAVLDAHRVQNGFLPIRELRSSYEYPLVGRYELFPALLRGVSGLLLLAIHLLAFQSVRALRRGRLQEILTGFYHLFVPSKHAQAFRRGPTEALGEAAPPPKIDLKSLLMTVPGWFMSKARVARARNQARKHGRLTDVLKAQTEELKADANLRRAASDREQHRDEHERTTGKS